MNTIGTTVELRELEDEKYTFVQQDQDIAGVVEYVPKKVLKKHVYAFPRDYVTGAVVEHGDGEYNEIWLSTSSAPYALSAHYTRVA